MGFSIFEQNLFLDVIYSLLQLLLDDRMPRMQEGGQLIRAMNVLMLQLMETANKTQPSESFGGVLCNRNKQGGEVNA